MMLAGEIIAKENALKSNQYLTENPFFFNEKVNEYKNLIILLLFKISLNSIIFYRFTFQAYHHTLIRNIEYICTQKRVDYTNKHSFNKLFLSVGYVYIQFWE